MDARSIITEKFTYTKVHLQKALILVMHQHGLQPSGDIRSNFIELLNHTRMLGMTREQLKLQI